MNIHPNHIKSVSILIVFAILFIASATTKKTAVTPLKVASYDYNPPSAASPKSSNIAFLLLRPLYAKSFQYSGSKVFSDFSKSMSADFNELLTARGYSVRGPYDNYDAIVYSDKKESDLMLEPEIDLSINTANVVWETKHVYKYPQWYYVYTFKGYMTLSGKVNLVASESISREKLWAKSIPLDQSEIQVSSERSYETPQDFVTAFNTDPGIVNPVITALEEFYESVMTTAWQQLDPNELSTMRKQVEEIREKKKY